ncbi:MAG: hypothetical protein ACK5Y2_06505 [Bdellovibrionales bacterium]
MLPSRPYRLVSFAEFGDIDNPIWHLEITPDFWKIEDFKDDTLYRLTEPLLIPLETLPRDERAKLSALPVALKRQITLQMGISQIHRVSLDDYSDFAMQVWIDREPQKDDLRRLRKFQHLCELVIVPFRKLDHFAMIRELSSLNPLQLSLLLVPKLNPFSGLQKTQDLYSCLIEIREAKEFSSLTTVTLVNPLKQVPAETRNLLLVPDALTFEAHEKMRPRSTSAFLQFLRFMSLGLALQILLFFLKSLRYPRAYFAVRARGWGHRLYGVYCDLRAIVQRLCGSSYAQYTTTRDYIPGTLHAFYCDLRAASGRAYGQAYARYATHRDFWPGWIHRHFCDIRGLVQGVWGHVRRIWAPRWGYITARFLGLLDLGYGVLVEIKWVFIRLFHRAREFVLNVLMFPFFKVYWFVKFQFEKRILRSQKR